MNKSFYGLMLVCLFVFGVKIMADDHYVRPPGTCTNTTLQSPYTNWDIAATQIQWAVSAAVLGDTVWVSNGVYVLTNYIALTNGIRLKNFSTNPDDTTIDGNLAVRCIYMTNAAAVLDGFTVTRGSIQGYGNGAGIYMLNGTVTNCTVVSNFAGERTAYTAFHEKACQEATDVAGAGFRSRGMSCFHSHSIKGHYLWPGAWLGPPWGCNLWLALEVQGGSRSHPDGTSSRYLFPVFARLSLVSPSI